MLGDGLPGPMFLENHAMAYQQTQYCQQSDIENVFGVQNVAIWSNLEGSASNTIANPTQVASAINYASNYVEMMMANSIYAIPLQGTQGALPPVLIDIIAKIAGFWLYSSRGLLEKEEKVKRIEAIMDRAECKLDAIINGKISIPLVQSDVNVNSPILVGDKPGYLWRGGLPGGW
jgi:hypothetical protein